MSDEINKTPGEYWAGPHMPPPAPAPLTPFVASRVPETKWEITPEPITEEESGRIMNVIDSGLEPEEGNINPETPTEKAHKSARINPDTPRVLGLAVFLVFVLMVSSFIVSFFGIWGVSQETTNIPDAITWLPALFLDAAILAYTISYFVFKARGEPVGKTRFALWAFALLSVAANIAHTLDGITPEMSTYSVAIGLMITGSAPIAVVLSMEEIARLAFERSPDKKK
jgi:hypothetical protein